MQDCPACKQATACTMACERSGFRSATVALRLATTVCSVFPCTPERNGRQPLRPSAASPFAWRHSRAVCQGTDEARASTMPEFSSSTIIGAKCPRAKRRPGNGLARAAMVPPGCGAEWRGECGRGAERDGASSAEVPGAGPQDAGAGRATPQCEAPGRGARMIHLPLR